MHRRRADSRKRHVMFWCSKEGMILLIAVSISTLYLVDRARDCIFLEIYMY